MTSLDTLYANLAAAKATWTPLKAALQLATAEWQSAVQQLGLPTFAKPGTGSRRAGSGGSDGYIDGYPPPVYTINDLAELASNYMSAKTAHDAAKAAYNIANSAVNNAVKGMGLP